MIIARVTRVDAGDMWCKCTSELLHIRTRRKTHATPAPRLTDINRLHSPAERSAAWKKIGSLFHLRLFPAERWARPARKREHCARIFIHRVGSSRASLSPSTRLRSSTILDPISPCVPPSRRRVIHECYITINRPVTPARLREVRDVTWESLFFLWLDRVGADVPSMKRWGMSMFSSFNPIENGLNKIIKSF